MSKDKVKTKAANRYTSATYEANRKTKLARVLKLQPNNKQVEAALKDIRKRRDTPKNRFWSSTRRNMATMFKRFTGKVHIEIFNNNDKISGPALMLPGPFSTKRKEYSKSEFDMFKISQRAKDKYGNYVWK